MNKVTKIAIFTITFVVLVVASYASLVLYMTWPVTEFSIDKAAGFGDSFGVITSVFSGLAFAGVIWTVLSQREELDITRNELRTQGFDTSFFQMLRLHNEILNSIDLIKRNSNGTSDTSRGRDCFVTFRARLKNQYMGVAREQSDNSEIDRIVIAYNKFWEDGNNELGHYFRFLFNLYRFIDESDGVDKKFYSNVVRSQLSDQELFVLFYNCLTPQGSKFMKYAIKYELFDNMKRSGLISLSHENLVDRKVFGERP